MTERQAEWHSENNKMTERQAEWHSDNDKMTERQAEWHLDNDKMLEYNDFKQKWHNAIPQTFIRARLAIKNLKRKKTQAYLTPNLLVC